MVESEVDRPAEVEGGGAVVEPGVVGDDAEVGDAAVVGGHQPGDGAFCRWTPEAVFGLPVGSLAGLAAGPPPASTRRAIAWLVAADNRRVPYLGVIANNTWLHHRATALNLRRPVNLGLHHADDAWALTTSTWSRARGGQKLSDHHGAPRFVRLST